MNDLAARSALRRSFVSFSCPPYMSPSQSVSPHVSHSPQPASPVTCQKVTREHFIVSPPRTCPNSSHSPILGLSRPKYIKKHTFPGTFRPQKGKKRSTETGTVLSNNHRSHVQLLRCRAARQIVEYRRRTYFHFPLRTPVPLQLAT